MARATKVWVQAADHAYLKMKMMRLTEHQAAQMGVHRAALMARMMVWGMQGKAGPCAPARRRLSGEGCVV